MAFGVRFVKFLLGLSTILMLYRFNTFNETARVPPQVTWDEQGHLFGNLEVKSLKHVKVNEVSITDKEIASRFEQRFKRLHKNCHARSNSFSASFEPNQNLLMSEREGLEVCVVPKSGSSSWHHLIWKLRKLGKGKYVNDSAYTSRDTTVNQFTSYTIKNKTRFVSWRHGVDDDFYSEPNKQDVFRIVLARHPFARLISAWNQKMLVNHEMWKGFFNTYPQMKEYNKYPIDPDHAMSWEDFATYVSDIKTRNLTMNYHFEPAHILCDQCKYLLTYVVKLEALDSEYEWLAKRLRLKVDLARNGQPKSGSVVNSNPGQSIQSFMQRLPHDVVKKLYELYKMDFDNFGYSFDFNTFEAGGFT